MAKQRYYRPALCLALIAVLGFTAAAQEKPVMEKPFVPEMSVAGIRLGDRASAKAFLSPYAPTTDEKGRPAFYFYNSYADQVMKVSAASADDLYFITEISVYAVDESYQRRHFHLKKTSHFITESKVFIGWRQSVGSMLLFPGVSRSDMIGPKDLVKKKGEPTARMKEGDEEMITYNLTDIELPGSAADEKKNLPFVYSAGFEFYKNRLTKFSLKIDPPANTVVSAKN